MRRMRTIIDAEYEIFPTPKSKKYGIVGEIGRVRKKSEKKGHYWVQVDNDVYELPLESLSPLVHKGLYSVNYTKLINSKLMKGVTLKTSTTVEELSHLFEKCGLAIPFLEGLSKEKKLPCLEISYGQYKLNLVGATYLLAEDSIHVPLDGDGKLLIENFNRYTGKNAFNILRAVTLLELPLCLCGDNHQEVSWIEGVGEIMLCLKCKAELYRGSSTDKEPMDEEILPMLNENSKYRELYISTASTLKEVSGCS